MSVSLWLEGLYASKVPTLLQHAFLVAQAVVAQERAHTRPLTSST
jgi:hypothetical protein